MMIPPEANSLPGRTMRQTVRAAVRMPSPMLLRLFGEPPRNDCGAPLDLQIHALLRLMEATGSPRIEELGAEAARQIYRRANQTFDLAPAPMHRIEDRLYDSPHGPLPARVYRPRPGKLPACVFYHGGGFVIGCPDTYDGLCRALARRAGCVVISVAYRLAPEHPFPAAVDDALAAFQWVRARADDLGLNQERIAVAGDSAGGNLAAVVCQRLVALDAPPPAHQLLIYPKTDHRDRYPSRERFAEGFYLTRALVDWFGACYLPEPTDPDPRVSPILFDALHALPPATVITAGFDPLRDEGEA